MCSRSLRPKLSTDSASFARLAMVKSSKVVHSESISSWICIRLLSNQCLISETFVFVLSFSSVTASSNFVGTGATTAGGSGDGAGFCLLPLGGGGGETNIKGVGVLFACTGAFMQASTAANAVSIESLENAKSGMDAVWERTGSPRASAAASLRTATRTLKLRSSD